MRFILRLLIANGKPLEIEEAKRLIAPSTLGSEMTEEGNGRKANRSGELIFEKSLDGLRGLRLVEQEGQGEKVISVSVEVKERFSKWEQLDATSFASFLLDEVLFEGDLNADSESAPGGRDLADALSFAFLAPDPLHGFSSFEGHSGRRFKDFQIEFLGPELGDWVIRNDVRYNPYLRWAIYFGIARSVNGSILIEPSECLRRYVEQMVFGELPLDQFLNWLGEIAPFTDRGLSGKSIRERIGITTSETEVSPGLSVGLKVLSEMGVIRLIDRDDSESFGFNVTNDSNERYSHIALGDSK